MTLTGCTVRGSSALPCSRADTVSMRCSTYSRLWVAGTLYVTVHEARDLPAPPIFGVRCSTQGSSWMSRVLAEHRDELATCERHFRSISGVNAGLSAAAGPGSWWLSCEAALQEASATCVRIAPAAVTCAQRTADQYAVLTMHTAATLASALYRLTWRARLCVKAGRLGFVDANMLCHAGMWW